MDLKLLWGPKQVFLVLGNYMCGFFANIWANKLKGREDLEINAKPWKLFNQVFVVRNILENCFQASLSSGTVVLNIEFFTFLCEFLRDEVTTSFWEGKSQAWNLIKSRICHREYFRKCFWSYLEFREEYFPCLKISILGFLQLFEWKSLKQFFGKQRKIFKTVWSKILWYWEI